MLVSYRVDTYSPQGVLTGTLEGVEGGNLTFQNSADVKASGSLTVTATADIDWLATWLMPISIIDGEEYPLGMYLPSIPIAAHTATAKQWDVKLMDKLTILAGTFADDYYTILAGTNVIGAVTALITAAGQTTIALTPSNATTRSDRTWPPDTTYLAIINDLLGSANFFSLRCDTLGYYTTSPYVAPADRPVRFTLFDDSAGIYSPTFQTEEDLHAVPNKITLRSTSTSSVSALTSTATNTDPASPYSYPRRGFWISPRTEPVDITSQAALDAEAKRRLVEATMATMSIQLSHAFIPVELNDIVEFRNVQAGLHVKATAMSIQVPLNPLDLISATYRRVVAL